MRPPCAGWGWTPSTLYQLHDGAHTAAEAEPVVAVLDELVAAGKVRHVGTSQDPAEVIDAFARSPHCVAVQSQVNVFGWSTEVDAAGSSSRM